MGCIVRAGNSADFLRGWKGVVHAADQIVDVAAGGIDQQDLAAALVWIEATPVLPSLSRTVEIRQRRRGESHGFDVGTGQIQQGHAEGRRLLDFGGTAIGAGPNNTSAGGSEPVPGPQLPAQERQQSGQVAGVPRRGEHQGQIRFSPSTQLADDVANRFLHRGTGGEGRPTTGR